MTTHDLHRNRSLTHSRPLGNALGSFLTQNYEQHYAANTHGGIRFREQSAPNSLPRVRINVEQTAPVASAHQKSSIPNQNLSKFDQQVDRSKTTIEERLACELTISYASATALAAEKQDREEILVMQRYSTGETSLVYRGYLTKGQAFSFKSQRRPTSSLSLAFYVQGSLDSEISECCEFKYAQMNPNSDDQRRFLFKDIQKANPCEKCRKDYAEKLLLNNDKNTLLVRRSKKPSQNHHQSHDIPKLPSANGHAEGKESSNEHQDQKAVSTYRKPKPAEVSHIDHAGVTATVDSNPQDPESKPTQSSLLSTKGTPAIPTVPITEQQSTEVSDGHPQNPNETEAKTTTGEGIDVQQFMQMLAAHFKQNTATAAQQEQSSRMKRHPKSVENFCYILENHLPISKDEQQALRGLINLGFHFDDINSKESIEFLKRIVNEKVILILSKTSLENLSKAIQDEPLLAAIYIIDSSEENTFDSKFYRGSFPDITRFCQQLKNDLQSFTYDLTNINSIPADFAGISTLHYVQALIDILLQTDVKRNLKKEMIDFCREEYADNDIQLKLIDEFETSFQPGDAVQWYVRDEAFLHKMMTRAFRVLDPDILFKLRYFIQHLHGQLKSHSDTSPLTAHRTLRIRKDLFDKMKKNQGGFLSFNEFVSVNKNQSTMEPSPMNPTSKLVHFQMGLGTGAFRGDAPSKPNEVLLTVGTIFRIDKLEPIDAETFTAKLTVNDEILKAGQLATKGLRDALHASLPLVRMLKLMKQRELTSYMEYFCLMFVDDPQAVEDEAANLTMGGVLHSLGGYYYEKRQYEQALNHLRCALKVYLRVLPDNDVRLTPTYNNIGSVHHKQGLNEEALEYHLKAYDIQKRSSDPDMDSVAAYVGNIAPVLMKLGRYKEAINYLEIDLRIKQKLHPNNDHSDVATRHHNLAGAQYRLQQYVEAVENYQKCLDIELKCHSADNPTVAVTYYNMATALEELGKLQEAKEAVEKAIARLLLTKEEDSEEVQMQRTYAQRLEQKIWMKNLFATT